MTIANTATPTSIAALSLPSGRWITWAKLFVLNSATGESTVACGLPGTSELASGAGFVTLGSAGGSPPSAQPLALTSYASFGSGGGVIELTCGVPAISGQVALAARWIKIVAMRVGAFTGVDMANGTQATVGSGQPKVIFGARIGAITVPNNGNWITVGKVWLGRGAWWLRAGFTLWESPQSFADCRLKVGKRTLDSASIYDGEKRVVTLLQSAAYLSSGQWAKVSCHGYPVGMSYGPEYVSNMSITAVRLGTLVTAARTYGSGKPRAVFYAAPNYVSLSAGPGWSTLGSVGTEAGRWMFQAKASVHGWAPATCQLTAEFDYDQTQLGSWGYLTLPLAVVHQFTDPGWAALRCQSSASGTTVGGGIRLVAVKLGALKNVQLP